jgi:type IV secretory pathway VirB10-like protein
MKIGMNRFIPVMGLLVATAAVLTAQDASQQSQQDKQYQGVSHPPADDAIVTSSIPVAKPPAGQPLTAQPAPQPAPQQVYVDPAAGNAMPATPSANPQDQSQYQPRPTSVDPSVNFPAPNATDGTDNGVVGIAPMGTAPNGPQALNTRAYAYDPDGDIVHPHPLRPGELQEGTSIRVRLLDRLSTADSERGEPFRTRVATDVLQGGQVLIPAGSEIDGRVVDVSSGQAGGHGTMRLEPDAVILPNGERFHLHAAVTGTPDSRTHVVGEGSIVPDSRAKRNGIEYGGAVGSGVVVGAIVAGPAGALAGGLIGAGAVTVHLLVSHPQATLDTGTTLIFQLTDRLYLAPEAISGN